METDDLMKSLRSHKYVKRTGSPGSYKYWYKMPDGSIQSPDEHQHQGKVDHAKRLLAGQNVHHAMSTHDIAAHTGLDHDKVTSAKRNLARAGTTWEGRTFAGHGYNEHHMKEAAHYDTSTPEYHAHAAASHGETHHVTEPTPAAPAAAPEAPARRPRRPRTPRAAPEAAASAAPEAPAAPAEHHHVDHTDEAPATSRENQFSSVARVRLRDHGFTQQPEDGSGLEAWSRTTSTGHTQTLIREDGKTRLSVASRSGTNIFSGSGHSELNDALNEAESYHQERVRRAKSPAATPAPETPEAPAAPAAPDNSARIAKLRAKLAAEHGLHLGETSPSAPTAERAAKAAAIARQSSPSAPHAAAVHAAAPDLAEADRPIQRMETAQAAGHNPYVQRASEIFHNIQGSIKPERAAIAKYMFQAIDHLKNTSQPLNEANLLKEYKRLSGTTVRGLSTVGTEFERATFTTLEEVLGNAPVDPEVERMKRGYGAKQFARMKPFIKQSWHDANPGAPPPYPTFGDVKSWTDHGGVKPEWAGNTRLAVPEEVHNAAHKGADGKPKYPPAWMPIHMMPAWNYVMKKAGDDTPYQARNVAMQGDRLALGNQAEHQEGMVIASLRKYVQMRGGPDQLTDIPGSKLSEVGLSHADIFKSIDPHDLSDKALKKMLKSKIVDPIALAPFIDETIKEMKPVKKSYSLVINGDLPKVFFISEDLAKSEMIRKIKAQKAENQRRGLA